METRLKNLREDHDLTQKQLSEYLNVSQVAYSYYELNRRSIPVEILDKLADYYNTSIDYLLYKTNVSTPYPKKIKAKSSATEKTVEYVEL
ncbi:MAG: helix-turn-helix transcriptional regulator [Clostridia bacterium]|nr:helix-turn-helix transcriptional regulator [Clostridia bacterium]